MSTATASLELGRMRRGSSLAARAEPPTSPQTPAHWHASRHRRILERHAEIRGLFGVDSSSAIWVFGLVAAQLTIAALLRHAPIWLIVLAVLIVGAPIAHALGVLIHECTHNLVFRSTGANKALAIVANLGIGAPGALAFRHEHLLHHRHLGDGREPDGNDGQAPLAPAVRWSGSSTWRKLFVFSLGRFFFRERTSTDPPKDRWLRANQAACGLFLAALAWGAGLRSVAYVLVSLFFAFGPHVVGARRLAEHLTLRRGQPTNSYYGPANRLAFDVGYHVEHHDFPYVPWRNLRRVRAIAEEAYAPLAAVSSWSELLFRAIVDPRRHLGQYVGASEDYVEPRTPAPLPPTGADVLREDAHPYFLWWADATVADLRRHLASPQREERAYWMGALLREANTRDVWMFVSVDDVRSAWSDVVRHLGRTRARWAWLLALPEPAWPPLVAHHG